jgi:hypothetical protein
LPVAPTVYDGGFLKTLTLAHLDTGDESNRRMTELNICGTVFDRNHWRTKHV